MWQEQVKMQQDYPDGSKWFLVNIEWFNRFMKVHKKVVVDNYSYIPHFDEQDLLIDNKDLLSKEFTFFQDSADKNKQNFNKICYTGRILRDDIKLNKNFAILSEDFFKYLCDKFKLRCDSIIYRYAFEDNLTSKTYMELNLQKVRILTIPDWSGHTDFEVVQFSVHDTVSDLYNRLIDSAETENKVLLKVVDQEVDVHITIKKIKYNYIQSKKLKIDCTKLEPSEENVMSLDLNEHSLLIIQDLQACNNIDTSSNVSVSYGQKSKMYDLDTNQTKTKDTDPLKTSVEPKTEMLSNPPNLQSESDRVGHKKPNTKHTNPKLMSEGQSKSTLAEKKVETKLSSDENKYLEEEKIERNHEENKYSPKINEFRHDQKMTTTQDSTIDAWRINEKVFSRESKGQFESGSTCGLDNLGNSCYMNSVLQVLSHTPNIIRYFVDGQYDKDKVGYSLNSIVSEELQTVMLNLQMGTQKSFSPKRFKNTAREYIELLDNDEQQDSVYFLIQLLDLIHNELIGQRVNKTGRFKEVKDKNDKSQKLKNNKDIDAKSNKVEESIISKNIHGKYSRTMFCEECKFESSSDDDFNIVSLQIPSIEQVAVHLKFYPAEPINGDIMIDYDFKFDSDQSLISEVQSKLELCQNGGIYYEYYVTSESNGDLVLINKSSPIREISEVFESELQCTVHLYELYHLENPCDYYDFKFYDKNKDSANFHDQIPIFKISIDQNDSLSELHDTVNNHLILRTGLSNDSINDTKNRKKKDWRIDFDFKATNNSKCPICNSSKPHSCEINADKKFIFKKLLNKLENQKPSFVILRLNPKDDILQSLVLNKQSLEAIRIKSIYDCSLKSCLAKFIADEVYPDYSCDECGKVANCIMKTTMSKLPKYLVIQLMRFESDSSYVRSILKKNNQFVDFPTKDLDLSNIYSGSSATNCIYDLYGVIHHSDEGGFDQFYTTICDKIKSKYWNMFRDELVEPCREKDVVRETAYILFYVKRED